MSMALLKATGAPSARSISRRSSPRSIVCSSVSVPMTKPRSTAGGSAGPAPPTRWGRVNSLICRDKEAIRRTSAVIARISSASKTKEPPRGRIITRSPRGLAAGPVSQWLPATARRCPISSAAAKMAASTAPMDGVVPPAARLSHSSARSAPARAETLTPSMSSTQVSTTTCGGCRHENGQSAGER